MEQAHTRYLYSLRKPLKRLGSAFSGPGPVLGFMLLLCSMDLQARTHDPDSAHENALRLTEEVGTGHFEAHGIPGGFSAAIDPHGFILHEDHMKSATLARFDVLGLSRSGILLPWNPGPPQRTQYEVYYPGETIGVHYQLSAQGLRQNFMVYNAPNGTGELRVTMRLSGTSNAHLDGTDALHFMGENGEALFDYRDLHCWDAMNTPLHAHFELTGDAQQQQLAIVVDDRDAHYPITIDPVSTSAATLLIGAQAGAEFGIAVATAGDLNGDGRSDVVVGAWQQTVGGLTQAGAAYVYYGTNAGISTVASVTLTSGQQGAQLGNAVSTAGDVNGDGYSDLLVGARTWESNVVTEVSEGGVFVYYGSSTGISTVANLILQPDHQDDNFGSNVACAGDINNDGYSDVLVGAYLSSYPTFNEGAVFVYMGSATGLSNVPQHRLERNQGGAFFGRSIAGAGDINGDGFSDVIVGSSKWLYTAGATDQGSAFIYYGSATSLGAGLNPAPALQLFGTGNNTAYYGWWVTGAGDLNGDGYSDVAVTAYNDAMGAQVNEGLVYVYQGAAAGLNIVPVAILQSNQDNAWMGRCVSTAGDVNGDGYADLLVGTPRYSNPEGLEGISQIFLGSAVGISTTASFQFELNNAGANFGESVSPAGDVNGDGYSDFIIGARIYGLGGAAAVYLGGPYSTNLTSTTSRFGGAAGALLGSSIANAGDLNGDGYADAIVGAPGASNGQAGEGLAYVHYGSAVGLSVPPSVTLEANVAAAQFGASVASAGDVNGDGYADVIVGAPFNGTGAAYIYMGSPGGLSTAPALTLTGGAQFGASVFTAGDVNADGYSEVIVGSPGSGEAYVYEGSMTGLVGVPQIVLSEPPASGLFGCSVSTAGDVNGDGFSDIIVGARAYSNGQAAEGVAFVFHGSDLGVVTPYARLLEVNQANADFGVSVASASDVNGDGFFDVVVGADLWESGQTDEGAAFVFYGTATGVNTGGFTTLQRNITDGRMGRSVAEGGDVNGDGYADVVVGAPLAENPAATANEGIAYVFKGSSAGINAAVFDQLEQNIAGYEFGTAVSGGGDVDGDGYSDVMVGAPKANPSLANEGASYWYRGDVARALNRYSRQYDADLVTPMSTNSQDFANYLFFGIGHRARSPIQRCRVKLRWEVVHEGQPYSGAPITNSIAQSGTSAAWTTLPLAGVEIKQLLTKASGYVRHKWRVRVEYDMAKLIDGQRLSRWFYGYAMGIGDIGILPVELVSFDGKPNGPVNDLAWVTATEHNTDRFEILRSDDGVSFNAVGSVPAAGESQSTLAYRYTDADPPRGTAFYRLRVVDNDGGTERSEVVVIARGSGVVGLYPNPADDQVQVLVGEHAQGAVLIILDAEGRVLISSRIDDDRSSQGIDVHDLAAGSYAVMLRDQQGAVIGSLPLIKR